MPEQHPDLAPYPSRRRPRGRRPPGLLRRSRPGRAGAGLRQARTSRRAGGTSGDASADWRPSRHPRDPRAETACSPPPDPPAPCCALVHDQTTRGPAKRPKAKQKALPRASHAFQPQVLEKFGRRTMLLASAGASGDSSTVIVWILSGPLHRGPLIIKSLCFYSVLFSKMLLHIYIYIYIYTYIYIYIHIYIHISL